MNQSTNFTITEYHWYSTPSKGMVYEFKENFLKNTSTKIAEIEFTHNITTEQPQQDLQTVLEGLTLQH